jgi:lipid II:glycine glycyltransferase (peptidoglycan interpeptide bridge formation enzyme)
VSARFADDEQIRDWNALVAANPGGGEVWSGREYALAKVFNGYTPRYVVGESPADKIPATLVLEKRVPLLGKLWYLPAGPAGHDATEVLRVAADIAELGSKEGVFLLKIEPRLTESSDSVAKIQSAGYRKTFRIVPNESTIIIDISGDESEVSARFSGRARNSIRRAAKEELVIRAVEPTECNCQTMFDLLKETSAGRFQLRPYEYYRAFWQTFVEAQTGVLLLGYKDDVPVAGIFGMLLGQKSVYKDGAARRNGVPTGTMNALQWELILWARDRGSISHDLCGAPHSSRVSDKTHPLYGVGQYKLAFNKDIIDYIGTFDLPLKQLAYKFWTLAGDRLARRLSLMRRHDPYY